MEYTTLGSTGMTVSRLCLGCWSFGSEMDWMLGRRESLRIIERAIDLGITYFDTANVYSAGESEEILGEGIEGVDRDRLVVQTKVYNRMDPTDPNSGGLSRKTIRQQLDGSLERLGLSAVDLYITHRWDDDTPIEATMRALHEVVDSGKAHYLGASAMWQHQFSEALHTSDRLGLEPFRVMQNHYNLAYREEEREVLPYCRKKGIAVTPFKPHASGYLAWPHEEYESTTRARTDTSGIAEQRPYMKGGGPKINERVEELADEKDVSMAQIALAWLLHKDWVTAPIVGVETVEHLEEAVEAVDVSLSDSDLDYLEEPYEALPVVGHS